MNSFSVTGGGHVDVLVVGGGGGGGGYIGGGGGAGGFIYSNGFPVVVSDYTVTVGVGGAGGVGGGPGSKGSNSVFSTITATGGGAGGAGEIDATSHDGGSGGGQGRSGLNGATPRGGSIGAPVSGQGNSGGAGVNAVTSPTSGGGGGGAGSVGGNGSGGVPGNGGVGTNCSISGSSVTYAGGGGGGSYAGSASRGGAGGGGEGSGTGNGTAGTDGLGGGGGAGAYTATTACNGGNGSSGIVIVRYVLTPTPSQMKITFGGYTNPSEVLTNFPVLVVFSNNVGGSSSFDYSHSCSSSGYDLRFATNSTDRTNSINYEIESWNPFGTSYVWVHVPTISTNGQGAIWANWGNTNASSQLACTTNRLVTNMTTPRRNKKIKYINPELPVFKKLEFKGTRYRDNVPDTLDLAERAALAVHGLTATTDPENNAELYWMAIFSSKSPFMYHDLNDWCEYKYYAPSALLRQASGSSEGLDVEWQRMANLLQMQGTNGLFWIPLAGRPWAMDDPTQGGLYNATAKEQMTAVWTHGRILEAAGVYYRLTGDERWKQLGDKAVAALGRLAVDCGDYAYFLKSVYTPEETTQPQKGAPPPPSLNHGTAWAAKGLTTYYRMTQSKPALELARKLARFYMLGHSGFVGPNGEFHGSHEDTAFKAYSPQTRTHFHMNSLIRMAMLDAGIESGDRALVEMAQRGYAFGKAYGNTLSGFFPEEVNAPRGGYGSTCELCCTADMIYLALRQS
ncbi:MAG: DUF2341 domain-containing protein, partial [Kiritimatiellia bacterium]